MTGCSLDCWEERIVDCMLSLLDATVVVSRVCIVSLSLVRIEVMGVCGRVRSSGRGGSKVPLMWHN